MVTTSLILVLSLIGHQPDHFIFQVRFLDMLQYQIRLISYTNLYLTYTYSISYTYTYSLDRLVS